MPIFDEKMPIIESAPIDIEADYNGGDSRPRGRHGNEGEGSSRGDDERHLIAREPAGGRENSLEKLIAEMKSLLTKEPYKSNCNKFVIEYSKRYAKLFNMKAAALPEALPANDLIKHMEKVMIPFVDGKTAQAYADRGLLCIAAKPDEPHGHVMIVVAGPGRRKGEKFYPNVLGGGTPGGSSDGSKTVADTWRATDLPKVKYYVVKSSEVAPSTHASAAPPKPEPEPER
jgi:hypothetical protein